MFHNGKTCMIMRPLHAMFDHFNNGKLASQFVRWLILATEIEGLLELDTDEFVVWELKTVGGLSPMEAEVWLCKRLAQNSKKAPALSVHPNFPHLYHVSSCRNIFIEEKDLSLHVNVALQEAGLVSVARHVAMTLRQNGPPPSFK